MSAACVSRNYTCHIFLSSMFLPVRLPPCAPCIRQVFMLWKKRAITLHHMDHHFPFPPSTRVRTGTQHDLHYIPACTNVTNTITIKFVSYHIHTFLNTALSSHPRTDGPYTPATGQGYLAVRALFHWLHAEWHWTKRQRSTPASAIYRQADEQELVLWKKSALATEQRWQQLSSRYVFHNACEWPGVYLTGDNPHRWFSPLPTIT